MTTIQQLCPGCGRQLQLPAEAVGKTARCPACEATFQVTGDAADVQPDPWAAGTAPVSPGSAPSGSVGSSPGAGPSPANPYQPSASTSPAVTIGPYQVVDVSFEQIFQTSWAIFQQRWVNLLLTTLVVMGVGIAMVALFFLLFGGVGMFFGAAGADGMSVLAIVLGAVIFIPAMMLLSGYIWTGWGRAIIAIAQDHPNPLSEMMPPMSLVMRVILSSLLIGAIVLGTVMFFGIFIGLLGAAAGPDAAATLGGIVGVIFQLAAQFVFQFFMWPWLYSICCGKSTAMGAIADSFRIAMHNKLTSLLIVVVSIGLSLVGTLMCYVGLLVTTPASMLLTAVAFLMMSSQYVADPRFMSDPGFPGQQPPPQQPAGY
ncbi:hypothetical protein V7x_50720 [Crateriforma conspicua]|uniref:Uncharacterized protein n=1 Tax=Crateriforma conspicua TaxID=2527996 RepID=A0A5C6FPZ2_9PLAN|nr:hypothetical protein [Crateriforma conspicua]TWU63332.1 hypothetical protein V7x_50720 [Crateriforma conspicua]